MFKSKLAASFGQKRPWTSRLGGRLVSAVIVAVMVDAAPFVVAQVVKEAVKAEPAPPPPAVAAPKAPAPARKVIGPANVKAQTVEVRREVAEPVLMLKGAVVANNMARNNMIKQWQLRLRPLLQLEYQFFRAICKPSKEQRIPIARAGLKALDEAVKNHTAWLTNENGFRAKHPRGVDIRASLQNALAEAAKEQLSAAQLERYRSEIDGRAAEQKKAAILTYLSKLDQHLVLSPEQVKEIRKSLESDWDESWAHGVRNFNLMEQYFPAVPDHLVTTHLNDLQKTIWAGTQKISPGIMIGGEGVGNPNNEPLDDEFSDEEALDAPKSEAKK